MTNKPMLSVELELLERLTKDWNGTDARIELRALLDKSSTCSESQVEPASRTPFEAAVKMCSDIDSYRKRRPHVPLPGRGSLHNTCIALYHKGYRLPDEQPAPVAVTHTMKSIMEAVEASRCYTVLTSDQCHALAQALNEVKP